MTAYTIGQAGGVDSNVRLRAVLSALVAGGAGTLKSRTGMLGNGLVTTRTAGMGLSVSPGRLWIAGTTDLQYGDPVIVDAAEAVTLDDGSSAARTDIVCVQVRDNPFDGSGAVGPRVFVVKGSAGGGVPATPTGAVKIAEQPVAANVSAGTGGLTADPVDKRPPRTAMQGGIPCVVDRNDASANLSVYDGLKVFRLDTGTFESRIGGVWVPDPVAPSAPPTWQTPALGNSWTAFNSATTPQYRSDGNGNVQLRGLLKGGAAGATAFTLPAAFRPSRTLRLGTYAHPGQGGQIQVNDDGTVQPGGQSSPTYYTLDGLAFPLA